MKHFYIYHRLCLCCKPVCSKYVTSLKKRSEILVVFGHKVLIFKNKYFKDCTNVFKRLYLIFCHIFQPLYEQILIVEKIITVFFPHSWKFKCVTVLRNDLTFVSTLNKVLFDKTTMSCLSVIEKTHLVSHEQNHMSSHLKYICSI